MPPSGKTVDVQLIDIIRFDNDGLAREHWGVVDLMRMMQQLGAIPEGHPPPAARALFRASAIRATGMHQEEREQTGCQR